MAIGSVKINTGRGIRQAPSAVPGQFGEGVSRALQGLSNTTEDQAEFQIALAEREAKKKDFTISQQVIEWQGQLARETATLIRESGASGSDLTNQIEKNAQASRGILMGKLELSPELQEEWMSRTESTIQGSINKGFDAEMQKGDDFMKQSLIAVTANLENQVREGLNGDEALAQGFGVIDTSFLDSTAKEIAKDNLVFAVRSAEYKREYTGELTAGAVNAAARDWAGKQVVLAGVTREKEGLLNAIADPESKGNYDRTFHGDKITDFTDHPRLSKKRADGRSSSAAGRYQFTATTWDFLVGKMGKDQLPDFSPASQDKAALYLAEYDYNRKRPEGALTFDEVLANGSDAELLSMREVLSGTWEGWKANPNFSDEQYLELMRGGEGTGAPGIPAARNDPKYDALPLSTRLKIEASANREFTAKQTEVRKAKEARHTAKFEGVLLKAREGEMGVEDRQTQIDNRTLSTSKEIAAFDKATNDYKERTLTHQEVGDDLTPGSVKIWSPATDGGKLDSYMGEEGRQSLSAMDQNYVDLEFAPMVLKAGFVPPEAMSTMVGLATSNDPKRVNFAYETLGNINATNPHALGRSKNMPAGLLKMINHYSLVKPYKSAGEMNEAVQRMADPSLAAEQADMMTTAEKMFKYGPGGGTDTTKGISEADILENLDTAFKIEADAPFSNLQNSIFKQDYRALYIEGYTLHGTDKDAKDYANANIVEQWSETEIGESNDRTLFGTKDRNWSRNSPENYYTTMNNSHDWIDYVARRELGLGSNAQFSLVADSQTRDEAQKFTNGQSEQNASYIVMEPDVEGRWTARLGPDGQPLRIFFDENDVELEDDRNWLNSYENLQGKLMSKIGQLNDAMTETGDGPLFRDPTVESRRLEADIEDIREELKVTRDERQSNLSQQGLDTDHLGSTLASDMAEEAKTLKEEINKEDSRGLDQQTVGETVFRRLTENLGRKKMRYDALRKEILDKGEPDIGPWKPTKESK